ncbi:MAG: hypothetical protein WBM44_24980 [Waterburya sp.]
MLILLTTDLTTIQDSGVENKDSTKNTVQTLSDFEVENSKLLCKICKIIPAWSMSGNLPMIPLL